MRRFKQIIRWPANNVNNLAPLYQVSWRMVWIIPVAGALFIFCVLAAIMYGPERGVATWRDNI